MHGRAADHELRVAGDAAADVVDRREDEEDRRGRSQGSRDVTTSHDEGCGGRRDGERNDGGEHEVLRIRAPQPVERLEEGEHEERAQDRPEAVRHDRRERKERQRREEGDEEPAALRAEREREAPVATARDQVANDAAGERRQLAEAADEREECEHEEEPEDEPDRALRAEPRPEGAGSRTRPAIEPYSRTALLS